LFSAVLYPYRVPFDFKERGGKGPFDDRLNEAARELRHGLATAVV
jgi:hypothetical protein